MIGHITCQACQSSERFLEQISRPDYMWNYANVTVSNMCMVSSGSTGNIHTQADGFCAMALLWFIQISAFSDSWTLLLAYNQRKMRSEQHWFQPLTHTGWQTQGADACWVVIVRKLKQKTPACLCLCMWLVCVCDWRKKKRVKVEKLSRALWIFIWTFEYSCSWIHACLMR